MTVHALRRPPAVPVAPFVALAGGLLLLLLRAQAIGLGGARVPILLLIYVSLAVIATRATAPGGERGGASARVVMVTGMAAVTAVAFAPWQAGAKPSYGALAAALAVVAAVAEEAFFRRLAYAWLGRWWGATAAVLLSAIAFAAIHVPLYGTAVFWIDLGAGILFSWQRWASGSWAPAATTHAFANLLAVLR